MAMDAELKRKWVEALRSGEFKQGKGRLYRMADDTYCCLGVLAHLQGATFNKSLDVFFDGQRLRDGGLLARELCAGLTEDQIDRLALRMNDCGRSFSEIADYIEREL